MASVARPHTLVSLHYIVIQLIAMLILDVNDIHPDKIK